MIRTVTWTISLALLIGGVLPCCVFSDVIVTEDFFYNEPTRELGTLGGFTLQDYAGGQNGASGQWTGLWVGNGDTAITGPDFAEVENQYMGIVGDLGIPVPFNYLQRGYQLSGLAADQPIYFAALTRRAFDDFNSMPRIWIHAPLNEESQIAIGYGPEMGLMVQLGFVSDGTFLDPVDDDEFHLLVGKLEVNADGDDERLTVWLDPTGPEESDESVSIESDVITSLEDLDGTLRLGRADAACCANRRISWDNVALGTSWEDVTQINVPRLKLEVNSDSGAATLVNDSGADFDLRYYEILSSAGALNVGGWSSMDDQNLSGGGWMENNPGANQLIESNFGGSTMLANGQSLSLGNPFAVGGAEDLVARVGTADGLLNLALVEYVTGGLIGDYNGNGVLDGPDLDLHAAALVSGDNSPEYDLNGDGNVDPQDRLFWIENLKQTWVGDSNLDLEFNTADFVQVFTAGKYEKGLQAGWDEGDWDGNLLFDTGDFVTAFTTGGYEKGPFPGGAVAAVPEPASLLLTLLGMISCLWWRKSQ